MIFLPNSYHVRAAACQVKGEIPAEHVEGGLADPA